MAYQTRRAFDQAYDRAKGKSNIRGYALAGMGVGAAIGTAAGAPGAAVGGVMGALLGSAGMLGGATLAIARSIDQVARRLADIEKPDTASKLVDTMAAFTMRQATIQAMHNSVQNLRGVLGNEATMLHR